MCLWASLMEAIPQLRSSLLRSLKLIVKISHPMSVESIDCGDSVRSAGARVTSSCEPPKVCAGNHAHVLWKSSIYFNHGTISLKAYFKQPIVLDSGLDATRAVW